MKVSKIIKGLQLIEREHGDVSCECLKNIIEGNLKQHDKITKILVCDEGKKKIVVIQ